MYFIRKLNDNGISEILCKTGCTHGEAHFIDYPYKMEGYKSYDRANQRMLKILDIHPEYNLDILCFELN